MAGSHYIRQCSLKLLKFNIEYINVMKLSKTLIDKNLIETPK